MCCTMVKSIFISLKFVLKVVRHSFSTLNECCIQHRHCCTLRVPIIWTVIIFYLFSVTKATTSQNEALSKIHTFDGCKSSLGSLIPRKCTLNLFQGQESFFYSIFSPDNTFGKMGSELKASDLPLVECGDSR